MHKSEEEQKKKKVIKFIFMYIFYTYSIASSRIILITCAAKDAQKT